MFESHRNTAMGAAILCPAVCVSNITSSAGMCGRSLKYVVRHPFSALCRCRVNQHVWQKYQLCREASFFCSLSVQSEPTWLHPVELRFEAEKVLCINIVKRTKIKHADEDSWTFLITRPACVSHPVPL